MSTRKILAAVVSAAMLVMLASCGDTDSTSSATSSTASVASTADSSVEASSIAPVSSQAPVSSEAETASKNLALTAKIADDGGDVYKSDDGTEFTVSKAADGDWSTAWQMTSASASDTAWAAAGRKGYDAKKPWATGYISFSWTEAQSIGELVVSYDTTAKPKNYADGGYEIYYLDDKGAYVKVKNLAEEWVNSTSASGAPTDDSHTYNTVSFDGISTTEIRIVMLAVESTKGYAPEIWDTEIYASPDDTASVVA